MFLGDFSTGVTLDKKFTTLNTSGVPTTLAGTPAVSVYKDNSLTQSTTGVTLSVDFDSVTGLNNVRIDLSADGTFYSAGANFQVVITTGTVGGSSVVGYVLFEFSIEARSALLPTVAGRKLDVSTGGEAGLDWANIGSPTTAQTLSGTSTKALEPTVASRTLDVTATGAAGIDWGNLENPTTANGLTGTTIATSQVVASVTGVVGSVTGAVGSVTGNIGGNVVGSVGSVVGAVGSVTGAVGSVTGNVGGGVVGSVGSVAGNVVGSVGSVTAPVTVGTNNDKTNYTLTAGGYNASADALIARRITGGASTGRTIGEVFAAIRNRVNIDALGNITVYDTDDATPLWTGVVTRTAGADPITQIDPS